MTAIPPSAETKALRGEYRKALSLQERALFFSKSLSTDDLLVQRVQNFGQETTQPTLAEDATRKLLSRINIIYGAAGKNLMDRLRDVSNKYQTLHASSNTGYDNGIDEFLSQSPYFKKMYEKVEWPDRDPAAVELSRKTVGERFECLVALVDQDLKASPPLDLDVLLTNCSENWKGLDTICELFMEEISFLSRRVDNFCNTQISVNRLKIAIWAIMVSVIISFLNLFANLGFNIYHVVADHPVNAAQAAQTASPDGQTDPNRSH